MNDSKRLAKPQNLFHESKTIAKKLSFGQKNLSFLPSSFPYKKPSSSRAFGSVTF